MGEVETVNSAHVVGLVSQSLSADKLTAMIVFEVATDVEGVTRKFALTFPTVNAMGLQSVFHDVVLAAERENATPGNALLRYPHNDEVVVGHSDTPQFKGKVVIQFDVKTPSEMLYVLSNRAGMALADILRKDIAPRLTMKERQDMQIIKPTGIIKPPSH